ncbi:MAG: hypothetical protein V1663_04160 [archaeon]
MENKPKSQNQLAKERYWKKVYENAPMIYCACGCGLQLKAKDKYGRDVKYINGHNNRKYEDPTEHKRAWNRRNKKQRYEYKKEYIRKRKISLIKENGGKCVHCGYKFDGNNDCCFDFHHLDPSNKLFSINQASLNRYALKNIYTEVEKCELVCALCHRLIHNNYN